MLKITERNFNALSPVIAFLDVFHSKAVGQICEEILICTFCSFYFYDTKLHEIKMSLISVKKLIKMRCVFTRINISVHIRLIFHNICSFVSEITFHRNIEFFKVVRKFSSVIGKQTVKSD